MKRFFLFLFASVLSISMFADPTYSGKTKAQAVPYDWSSGIFVESTAGVGKWYVVMLREDQTDYAEDYDGPFDATGKTVNGGLTNINVSVINPLDKSATIDVIAYIGDNETSRHFTLAPGGRKEMTFGAGMFIKMGIDRVFLYLVMDVTITEEEAAAMDAVNVNVTPVENENTVVFTPIDFVWTNWPNKTAATVIPANKETWVKIDFNSPHDVANGYTYEFFVEKDGSTPTTLHAGLSYDCPATSIQEQDKVITSSTSKVLDQAKLDIMPKVVYVRLKADQEIRLHAKEVEIPQPTGPAIFNIYTGNAGDQPAIEVLTYDETNHPERVYSLNEGNLVYSVDYSTLSAEEYYYKQIEVKNNGTEEIAIVGKASKTYDTNGDVFSVVSKTVVIPAGQTYVKKIDKSMQSVVGKQAGDKIYAVGPASNVTFKLTEVPEDPEYCQSAVTFDWNDWNQQNGGYKWYSVNIADAKDKKADIVLTMETVNPNEEANITVDLAAACALGEPTQSYTGKSKSTQKTLSYSLYKDNQNNVMYVRVRTDKNIKVKAELLTTKTWNGTKWSGDESVPTLAESARIEGNLVIGTSSSANIAELKALGLTLAGGNITIEKDGKLIIGKEGIKGSENVNQIIVEDGGILLIDPACTSNNKPFITAKKGIMLGKQNHASATLPELHDFIALPIENREASVEQEMRYAHWDRMAGWIANDGFRQSFIGYNVYAKDVDAAWSNPASKKEVVLKGQLAANKNQTLSLPANGWYAFGNSWTAAIPVSGIYSQLAGNDDAAVHFYVATPTDYSSQTENVLGLIKDNYYIPATSEIASQLGISEIKPMQGFFLHTESSYSITLDYNALYEAKKAAAPKRVAADNRNMVAAVLSDGEGCDFVYMIEGEAGNAHKMIGEDIAIYAEDGLAQIANDNIIGTVLTIQTNEKTEYTLHFGWLKGETLYLKDLANGNIIAMTAENTYTFNAEPNSVSERFQVVGRNNVVTGMENSAVLEGANKRIENGKVVIIKNGVKYDVLGAQL